MTTPRTPHATDTVALLAMALPLTLYVWALWQFCVNVPYWDDFSVILDPLARVLAAPALAPQLDILLTPNGGHMPLLTRLVSLLQIKIGGAVDFRQSAILANLGWLATLVILVRYFKRELQLPWLALLPLPFLLLSITHWEAMDFTTPAWQMYWGSALLPVVALLAVLHGRWLVAAVALASALFTSSGTLALYPLLLGYGLVQKQWRGSAVFALCSGAVLAVFFYYNPPDLHAVVLPAFKDVLRFIPAFMGNIVGTGSWYLGGYAWIHWPVGLLVIIFGVQCVRAPQHHALSKLMFVYVLLLACMAVYLRGAEYSYVVSRYSPFALLVIACLYCTYASQWWHNGGVNGKRYVYAAIVIAAGLWVHSYYTCLGTLAYNKAARLDAAQRYVHGGELGKLLWDEHYGQHALKQATATGVFNTAVWRDGK